MGTTTEDSSYERADFEWLHRLTRWNRDTWVDAWHLVEKAPNPHMLWNYAVVMCPVQDPLETVRGALREMGVDVA